MNEELAFFQSLDSEGLLYSGFEPHEPTEAQDTRDEEAEWLRQFRRERRERDLARERELVQRVRAVPIELQVLRPDAYARVVAALDRMFNRISQQELV